MKDNGDGTVSYTEKDLENMSQEQVNNVLMTMTKIEGRGVVRGADGQIKYDATAVVGDYGELDNGPST